MPENSESDTERQSERDTMPLKSSRERSKNAHSAPNSRSKELPRDSTNVLHATKNSPEGLTT